MKLRVKHAYKQRLAPGLGWQISHLVPDAFSLAHQELLSNSRQKTGVVAQLVERLVRKQIRPLGPIFPILASCGQSLILQVILELWRSLSWPHLAPNFQ